MLKVIQFLVYTFTNRLVKTIHITYGEGVPTPNTQIVMYKKLNSKHNCQIVLHFNSSGKHDITEIYTKK
jgi:hypothetical protein